MTTVPSKAHIAAATTATTTCPKVSPSKQQRTSLSPYFHYSPKTFVYILATSVAFFILLQIRSLQTPPSLPSWTFNNCTHNLTSMAAKLSQAVTFLPIKDLRYAKTALLGHTWFMSSTYDTHEEGQVQIQQFPSHSSQGRLLCVKGRDAHDGTWNSYALSWPEALPPKATLMKGLTFVSYNHYDYQNIWHGLSAVMPFLAWHKRSGCRVPARWVLYHWGELRTGMGPWLRRLMEAALGGPPEIEGFEGLRDGEAACFTEAVVARHNEGGMSRERRMEVYDLLRCKARVYCNVSVGGGRGGRESAVIGMTIFMRTGARSFRNESAVVDIFERECAKIEGCRLVVVSSNNLSFCEQVKVMSTTDILISPHGAQLTNMFLMDGNSSVMEFFPKGWLQLAGVGQYVYHWMASWSGMTHQGAWRDPDGATCPYSDRDPRCMSIYKGGLIGHNHTFFAEWARKVLSETKLRKMEDSTNASIIHSDCGCG